MGYKERWSSQTLKVSHNLQEQSPEMKEHLIGAHRTQSYVGGLEEWANRTTCRSLTERRNAQDQETLRASGESQEGSQCVGQEGESEQFLT